MPKVIVNSSPLIVLSSIDRLNLLERLYGEIVIPKAVWDEVIKKGDAAGMQLQLQPSWIYVEDSPQVEHNLLFSAKLHAGEIEVMSIALAHNDSLAILDDGAARRTAKYLGLKVTGTLGVLLRAKERGILDRLRPSIDAMAAKGFFMSDSVIAKVLELAGE